ncbi:hypothetical protein [uncultured Litoreibacter sp.]|uniref:hypothetical protein n=1 Tax=uncultured Litoreibacter sp. TaxID=1392394 RepID=UPI0026203F82|nr:hypothetical protein [uncultured Litoreibacter sp.]
MSIIIVCLELLFVWLVYFAFGVATEHNLPIWLTALLVIIIDRTVTSITSLARRRRDRLKA